MITHSKIYEFLANNETLTIEERQMITEYVGQQIECKIRPHQMPTFNISASYDHDIEHYNRRIKKLEIELKYTKGFVNRRIIKDDIKNLNRLIKKVYIKKLVDEEYELELEKGVRK